MSEGGGVSPVGAVGAVWDANGVVPVVPLAVPPVDPFRYLSVNWKDSV